MNTPTPITDDLINKYTDPDLALEALNQLKRCESRLDSKLEECQKLFNLLGKAVLIIEQNSIPVPSETKAELTETLGLFYPTSHE